MHALDIQSVSFSYDGKTNILENLNLTLHEGELICLLGVSGGGKTTLFNVIAGLNRPQTGKVLLGGEDITGQSGKISYMLQKDMLLPYRTVEDNVALPLIIKGAGTLPPLASTARKSAIRRSFREVCASARHCCAPICSAARSRCSTNRSARSTP